MRQVLCQRALDIPEVKLLALFLDYSWNYDAFWDKNLFRISPHLKALNSGKDKSGGQGRGITFIGKSNF